MAIELHDLTRAQRDRLAFIELRVRFLGEVRRQDLFGRFGIQAAAASRDLAAYKDLAPGNLHYDSKNKGGGVTVSYFEWTQNIQQFRWSLQEVITELEKKMVATFHELMSRTAKDGTLPRQAAFDISLERVAKAITLRGFV